jgi:hypothetical protein
VAAVVVAAAVDAAADVQVDVADVVQAVQVVEALGDRGGDGIERALASAQRSPPGQAIMSVSRPMLGVAKPPRARPATARAGRLVHPGQQQVLVVRHAQLAVAEALGQVGGGVHLLGRHVARRQAGALERQRHGAVARERCACTLRCEPALVGGRGVGAGGGAPRSGAAPRKPAATRSNSACGISARGRPGRPAAPRTRGSRRRRSAGPRP